MARRKNAPESIRIKHGLSDRLRSLRTEFYGERGGPDLARTLGIPVRTWYNYENGVTVPAEIILRVVELTSVEPVWLLRGEGAKFRAICPGAAGAGAHGRAEGLTSSSITTLLRVALERLEEGEGVNDRPAGPPIVPLRDKLGREMPESEASDAGGNGPRWGEAHRAYGNLRVVDDSMTPIVAEGANVSFAEPEPPTEALHDRLVVVQSEGESIVRWYQHCGRFALLRAENPAASPPSILVDLDRPEGLGVFHRVLWISTPH